MDYHVWNSMLEHYQRHMIKVANVMPSWKTALSTTENDFCFTSSLIRNLYQFLQQILIVCCCNCWALTLRTVCLNTERAIGIWHSWLKHFNCWWNAVKKVFFIHAYLMWNCMFTWKKWTLKFRLMYLRNYISYFNKTCNICIS